MGVAESSHPRARPANNKQAATLKTIILNNWTSPDMRGMRSYTTSYTLRCDNIDIFTIHLNRQLGFYQISEFISPDPQNNFTIEQTNRVGAPQIAAFDKETGNMLGVFKGNTLIDENEVPVFHITPAHAVDAQCRPSLQDVHAEDFAGVLHRQKNIAAIFSHLPHRNRAGVISRIRHWLNRVTQAPVDVLEVQVINEDVCDFRMICAVAVILHNRGGLYLK